METEKGEKVEAGELALKAAVPRATVPVPLYISGALQTAKIVSFDGLADGREHVAVILGNPSPDRAPLVRIHSECLTGDVFGSARCDCGPQLDEALGVVSAEGGVIIYLRQEGRGIGLYNKLDAYTLQDDGYDTFEANRVLNFADDARDYTSAAQMLLALDMQRIRLLSNNPDKSAQLRRLGVEVCEQKPTGVFLNYVNKGYLQSKVSHSGHKINLDQEFDQKGESCD